MINAENWSDHITVNWALIITSSRENHSFLQALQDAHRDLSDLKLEGWTLKTTALSPTIKSLKVSSQIDILKRKIMELVKLRSSLSHLDFFKINVEDNCQNEYVFVICSSTLCDNKRWDHWKDVVSFPWPYILEFI